MRINEQPSLLVINQQSFINLLSQLINHHLYHQPLYPPIIYNNLITQYTASTPTSSHPSSTCSS